METVRSWTDRDLRRLDEIIVEGERRFKERQPRSGALIGEAREVLAGGATSSWQIARPQMIWVSHGEGSKIYDADGGEYVDLHGGYGVGAVGHGHPKIVEAVRGGRRAGRTSPSRRRMRSSWLASWRGVSGFRCGASPTRAPRRRWTRCTSCVRSRAGI